MSWHVYVICLCLFSSSLAFNTYVAKFPNSLIPGVPLSVRVNILQSTRDTTVTTSLVHASNGSIISSNSSNFHSGEHGSIQLQVPGSLLHSSYKILVSGSGGLTFRNESAIHYEENSVYIYIQTDKSRYSAGQEVKYRVIALLPNLMGYNGNVTVTIFDGKDNKIQIFGPHTTADGVIRGTLKLSDKPVFGDWKVTASVRDITQTKVFVVRPYVLPRFAVDIVLPTVIRETDPSIVVNVTSRYTFNKPVFGNCTIQIYLVDDTIIHKEYSKQIYGNVSFDIPMDDMKYTFQYSINGDINIRALVTDNATALTMASEKELKIERGLPPITITKVDKRDYFVPGIDYYTTVFVGRNMTSLSTPGVVIVSPRVTTAEKKPCTLNNPPIYWDIQYIQLKDIPVPFDETGLASFKIPVSHLAQKIEISLKYMDIHGYFVVRALSINPLTMFRLYSSKPDAKVGDIVTLSLESTEALQGGLSIELYARGIFLEAHDIQLPAAPFQLTIKPEMVPHVYIVATFTTKDGRLLSDDVFIDVEGSPFKTNVTVAFSKTLLHPGDSIQLQISAEPNSTVYVLSEDERNRLLGSENDVYFNEVVEQLETHTMDENIALYPKPFGRKRNNKDTATSTQRKRSFGRFGDIDDVFIEIGIIVLSDTTMYEKAAAEKLPVDDYLVQNCPRLPINPTPAAGVTFSPLATHSNTGLPLTLGTVVRSKFPETWIWDEYTVGSSGQFNLDMIVPDSITSWVTSVFASNINSGFGITETKSKITVQKDFFLTMDLPASVVFGEEYLLQVSVFNYMSIPGSQQVFLQINITEKSGSQIIPAATTVQQGQGHSTYVHVIPKAMGQMKIQVIAKAGGLFLTTGTDSIEKEVTVTPAGVQKQSNEQHLIQVTTSHTPSTFNKNILLTDPPNMMSGTKRSTMRITGNFMVPSINGLQNLIRMPHGCGEQTMLNFAPDIYITKYLKTVGKLTPDVEKKSNEALISGLQRELTYQHKDGSFSAFGDKDRSGSSWLTAFVLKCFHQAEGLINIDESITSKAMTWLLTKQQTDGSFLEPGRIIHTQMQAGTSSGIKLTSFILVSVLENKNSKSDHAKLAHAISQGRTYLETQLHSVNDMYTLAMVCYALAMSGSAQKAACFTKMKQSAILDADKQLYWRAGSIVSFGKRAIAPRALGTRAPSADIETTSYCLLTYIKMGEASDAFQIVKWLVAQRNPHGGFESTQDTVVSLQALSEYSSVIGDLAASGPTYGVNFDAKGGAYHHAYATSIANRDVLHEVKLPDDLTGISIQATGEGIAVVDVTMSFYINAMPNDNHISVRQTISKESLNSLTVTPCFRWHGNMASGMIVMQVEMPTGFVADPDVYNNQPTVKLHETTGRFVVLYFDGVAANHEMCVNVKTDRSDPVVKSQACHIIVFDYYEPTHQAMTQYESGILKRSNICDVCPLCNFCSGATDFGQIGVGK